MFRAFETRAKASTVTVDISPYIESVEWDIYQISVQTSSQVDACTCEIHHNGYFLCGTNQGFKDSAVGPPDLVALPSDTVTIIWNNVAIGDQCQCGIWYNENPTGTTFSTSH